MTTKQKLAFIAEQYPESLTADGFDDAIIGFDASGGNVIYDYNKCLKILMERDNMDYTDAHEYMEFNVVSAYVGDLTPYFMHKL